MIVEQNDQTVADVDEGDFLIADRREIKLGTSIQMDDKRLIGLWLDQPDNLQRFARKQSTSDLGNRKTSVHDVSRSIG